MGSEAVDIVSHMNPWVIFMTFFGILFIIQQCISIIRDLGDTFGIERKEDIEKKELKDSISELSSEFKESVNSLSIKIEELQQQNNIFKEDMDNITTATREELGDKINVKFKRYFEIGYIPADEFDEFVNLHNAYKIVGGNHTGDAKYKKCISSLKVKDDSTPESKIII